MQNSLFDLQNRYASLSEAGDPLERLNAVIDWEIFRPILARIEVLIRTKMFDFDRVSTSGTQARA